MNAISAAKVGIYIWWCLILASIASAFFLENKYDEINLQITNMWNSIDAKYLLIILLLFLIISLICTIYALLLKKKGFYAFLIIITIESYIGSFSYSEIALPIDNFLFSMGLSLVGFLWALALCSDLRNHLK